MRSNSRAAAVASNAEEPAGAPPAAAVSLRDVRVSYDQRLALDELTLDLPRGQVVSVIGPNGSGKSTLLKAIVGLVPLAGGSIELRVTGAGRRGRAVAYVPQHESVHWDFPAVVQDVVMMGRYPRIGWFRRPGRADREAVRAALERMGMWEQRRSQIAQLSGGQQQRVFLARALAQDAPLILLDEPLTGVDATSEDVILTVAGELAAEGRTVVMATHDLAHAAEHSDMVVCLNRRLIAAGPSAEVFTPEVLAKTYGGPVILFSGHRD